MFYMNLSFRFYLHIIWFILEMFSPRGIKSGVPGTGMSNKFWKPSNKFKQVTNKLFEL